MNLIKIAIDLTLITENETKFFIRCNPEILDFTNKEFSFKLYISSVKGHLEIEIDCKNIKEIISLLKDTIFFDNATVMSWNIKSLFSYIQYSTKTRFEFNGVLIDIKIMEAFLDNRGKTPENFLEAFNRCKDIIKDIPYVNLKNIYKNIHLPLIKKTIPNLETFPIGSISDRKFLYSYYEIEGQANGRLCCSKSFKNCYNPHSLDIDTRKNLKSSKTFDDIFISFDYSHMEVSVLSWLTKDPISTEILNSGKDFYKMFYQMIFGKDCDTDKKRNIAKSIFLPIVYGQSAYGLSSSIKIDEEVADKLIFKVKKIFNKTFNWIENYKVVDGVCYDYFGRRRIFKESLYPIRNFLVQSPASLICLNNLIKLNEALIGYGNLMCSIHDGYIVVANKSSVELVKILGKSVLEAENDFCPGLVLKVNCKSGQSLDKLE